MWIQKYLYIKTDKLGFHSMIMEKWYQIILITFHLPARFQATGYDSFKHKLMTGTFSRDNLYGNRKSLHRKQQQQQRWTRANSLEMVRCTSPAAAKHYGWWGGVGEWGCDAFCNTKISFIPYRQNPVTEWNAGNEWWVEGRWSNKGLTGRKSERTTGKTGSEGGRKRDGAIRLISKTTPMTEPFFISQSLYTVYVNPGGQTTAEECDHNLSILNA